MKSKCVVQNPEVLKSVNNKSFVNNQGKIFVIRKTIYSVIKEILKMFGSLGQEATTDHTPRRSHD